MKSRHDAGVAGIGVEELRSVVASPRSFLALGNQWESSDADAVRLDHDDAAVIERLSELGQVRIPVAAVVGVIAEGMTAARGHGTPSI